MGWPALLLAAAAALAVLLLLLKLRGPGGGLDLTGPPGRGRVFTPDEAGRLADLVKRGESGEAVRLIRAAGHGEAEALKLVALIERLGGRGDSADRQ